MNLWKKQSFMLNLIKKVQLKTPTQEELKEIALNMDYKYYSIGIFINN